MSTKADVTQLRNGQRRRAERAERTAERHQEYVDRWTEAVESRPRGSAARRRAERNLRRSTHRRDRALERARRHHEREAGYDRRLENMPADPPRPRTVRWVPKTPVGKAVATFLLLAGLVTGALAGNPFDDDSDVAVDIPVAAPAAPTGNGGNGGPGEIAVGAANEVIDDAEAAAREVAGSVEDPADVVDRLVEEAEEAVENIVEEAEEAVENIVEEADQDAVAPVETAPRPQPTSPPVPVDTTDEQVTVGPAEPVIDPEPTPQPEPTPDPEATPDPTPVVDPELVDECIYWIEMYPGVLEVFPAVAELCFEDPEAGFELVITYVNGLEMTPDPADVDECIYFLEVEHPELAVLHPGTVELCETDPTAGLAAIYGILDGYSAMPAEGDVAECFALFEEIPELADAYPDLMWTCETDPVSILDNIEVLLADIAVG